MRSPATNYYRTGLGARDSAAGPGPKFFSTPQGGPQTPTGQGKPREKSARRVEGDPLAS